MEIINFIYETATSGRVLHVISVVFGMGAALMSDILFNFYSKDRVLNKQEMFTLKILSNVVVVSLPLIILSGILIFLGDPAKYGSSDKFLAKMTIMGILLLNGFILNYYVWPHLKYKGFFVSHKEKRMRTVSFMAGAISVLSWLAVCTLGVLDKVAISYSQIMVLYFIAAAVGIVTAIAVEHYEFE